MKYKPTIIISAFPGCGKSYMFNNYNGKPFTMLDSDSSQFSWIKDDNENNTKERNPDFPNNYIKHIKDNIRKVDVIFVSSHAIVRKALNENSINFFMVYPNKCMKDEWIGRFKQRGNDKGFIKLIADNWDNFISEIENEEKCLKEKLSLDNPYINNKYLAGCFDTSMGNLSSLWWN
jgi:hypothetical protein